ncbi:MAG: nucleotide exchange factor GrpE [bacterium]|nr:nucleotide exchange factor GrpE [bacterium]
MANGAAEAWTEEVPPANPMDGAQEALRLREELTLANDRLLRLRAEFDNYRRRTQLDQLRVRDQAVDRVVLALLPALDDLERVRQTATPEMDLATLFRGLDLVLDKFAAQLEQVDVRAFSACGEPFDPTRHEALSISQDPAREDDVVVEEHVRGYLHGETVIRHAQVIVNKR